MRIITLIFFAIFIAGTVQSCTVQRPIVYEVSKDGRDTVRVETRYVDRPIFLGNTGFYGNSYYNNGFYNRGFYNNFYRNNRPIIIQKRHNGNNNRYNTPIRRSPRNRVSPPVRGNARKKNTVTRRKVQTKSRSTRRRPAQTRRRKN